MAEILFYANVKSPSDQLTLINHSAGSGIGFYGLGFGTSVPVGSVQRQTWTTNSDGTANNGIELNNTAMQTVGNSVTPGTVSINGGEPKDNDILPNYLCPLNIRFTHSEAVAVQNCKLRIFDRTNVQNPAVGVTTYVYEARNPQLTQGQSESLLLRGEPNHDWKTFSVVASEMAFTNSPGVSGTNTSSNDLASYAGISLTKQGAEHRSTRHDWYVALSSEPETIGSKTQYGLYFSVEYL